MRNPPRLIPVLDVMNGRVVRAVGGRRDEYRSIVCPFTGSHRPYDVAGTLLQMTGANELYIADLDAILGRPRVARAVEGVLKVWPVPTWLDAGIGSKISVADLLRFPTVHPVVGFETCSTPGVLREAVAQSAGRPLAFSVDLKDGRLLGRWRDWGLDGDRDALGLARRAVDAGVRALIVLDLARVGTGTGAGTEPLLRAIRNEFPGVELIAGGGVKSLADVEGLGEAGADAVLVSSALHGGTLTPSRPTS
jgi:phosphoribosylformimino-5-aminoimidazole carboxamide ribotide isomerase